MSSISRTFASDNYSGCLPEVLEYIQNEINIGHQPAYGDDAFSHTATELIQKELGSNCQVFYVMSGTAANVIGLDGFLTKTGSIIAADTSHLCMHETGAPHRLLGAKFLTINNQDGKINPEQIELAYHSESKWGRHSTKPETVSITQPTEYGTVYTPEQIAAIASTCHRLSLKLHMDGCRIYNAAVSLNCTLAETTFEAGVDVLSLGGTKNGLMHAEAIVLRDVAAAEILPFKIKQLLNLQSKHRYLSGQFIPFFKERLWEKAAKHSNQMATSLAKHLEEQGLAKPIYPVQTNQIFARMKKSIREKLTEKMFFYTFEEADKDDYEVIRLVTSFDTCLEDIHKLKLD